MGAYLALDDPDASADTGAARAAVDEDPAPRVAPGASGVHPQTGAGRCVIESLAAESLAWVCAVGWPLAVVAAAALNMALSRTFSSTELIFAAAAGAAAGGALYVGLGPDPGPAARGVMSLAHGVPLALGSTAGLLDAPAAGLAAGLALLRVAATALAGWLDRRALARGPRWAGVGWGLPLAALRATMSPVTSTVGLALFGAAWLRSLSGRGRVGRVGSVLVAEWNPDARCGSAVSLGSTVHGWAARAPLPHELYHARQYLYLGDSLVPLWLIGCGWGLASAKATGRRPCRRLAIGADRCAEVGNPLEVAAYRL